MEIDELIRKCSAITLEGKKGLRLQQVKFLLREALVMRVLE